MDIVVQNPEIVTISIAIGLVISLVFTEFFGIAAGGMVVPGYMALFLTKPMTFLVTLIVSFITYFLVYSLSSIMIIYGRRRTVLMILVGFLMGWLIKSFDTVLLSSLPIDVDVVGYIIPGLIAIWIDRQGMIETYTALLTSTIIIRLLLILAIGWGIV